MLQQTQVATVVPYFHRFIERFPTFAHLAGADEQDVLRLWQGLGYYSRARNLRAAAIKVVTKWGGNLPDDMAELLSLPGVGRYTAGAIASIAFGKRVPILDGNVARVICRLDKIRTDPREKHTLELLWTRAADILPAGPSASAKMSDFNSALMELGATVCTPRNPQCLLCPVQTHCEAFAAGIQETIPPARKAKVSPLETRWTTCIRRAGYDGAQWMIEQRPAKGRWAGMWQFVTRQSDSIAELPIRVSILRELGIVEHKLTHRRYRFHVRAYTALSDLPTATWASLAELDRYPMPRPHVKIAGMLT